MESQNLEIALLHHTGGGNFGDDATMDVVIANIRRRWPDAEITALSMNPSDTKERHGVPSLPLRRHRWSIGYGASPHDHSGSATRRWRRWFATTRNPFVRVPRAAFSELAFLISSFRAIRKFHMMIVSGGGQLTERSGPWGYPYAIFLWTMMARIGGVRCRFLNVGAGPLHHPISKFLVTRSLYAAEYVSFRDEPSQALARVVGYGGPSEVFPDSAYLLAPACLPRVSAVPERIIVGVAPMPFPFCDPREYPGDHQAIYEEMMAKIGIFASELVRDGYQLALFGSDAGSDPACVEHLRRILSEKHGIETPPYMPVDSVSELLSRMAEMNFVVTCRFHGAVFAQLLNKPILAIAHHPKVTTLMHSLELSDYCLDIQTFDPADLLKRFKSLVRHSEMVKGQLATSVTENQRQLECQYDALFPPPAGSDTSAGQPHRKSFSASTPI